mmetsp:Transcript_3544/g.10842  ORF Transcript_3544/g.10842 Transcript_3544/m.10842 type:complete len:228 (-) Transcript_3544:294-977(-)
MTWSRTCFSVSSPACRLLFSARSLAAGRRQCARAACSTSCVKRQDSASARPCRPTACAAVGQARLMCSASPISSSFMPTETRMEHPFVAPHASSAASSCKSLVAFPSAATKTKLSCRGRQSSCFAAFARSSPTVASLLSLALITRPMVWSCSDRAGGCATRAGLAKRVTTASEALARAMRASRSRRFWPRASTSAKSWSSSRTAATSATDTPAPSTRPGVWHLKPAA